jgi:hypothetical protein
MHEEDLQEAHVGSRRIAGRRVLPWLVSFGRDATGVRHAEQGVPAASSLDTQVHPPMVPLVMV